MDVYGFYFVTPVYGVQSRVLVCQYQYYFDRLSDSGKYRHQSAADDVQMVYEA